MQADLGIEISFDWCRTSVTTVESVHLLLKLLVLLPESGLTG